MTSKNGARILVVDDEPGICSSLARLLGIRGYSVQTATDGATALAIVDAHRPDLVITDLIMPGIDGLQLLARLRDAHSDLPVIIATASADLPSAVKGMRAGAADYVAKPIDMDALALAIEQALEKKKERVRVPRSPLTPREREVLQLLSAGKSSKEIAGALNIAVPTVETHRRQLMDKVGLRTIAELTKYAIRAGLTSVD